MALCLPKDENGQRIRDSQSWSPLSCKSAKEPFSVSQTFCLCDIHSQPVFCLFGRAVFLFEPCMIFCLDLDRRTSNFCVHTYLPNFALRLHNIATFQHGDQLQLVGRWESVARTPRLGAFVVYWGPQTMRLLLHCISISFHLNHLLILSGNVIKILR